MLGCVINSKLELDRSAEREHGAHRGFAVETNLRIPNRLVPAIATDPQGAVRARLIDGDVWTSRTPTCTWPQSGQLECEWKRGGRDRRCSKTARHGEPRFFDFCERAFSWKGVGSPPGTLARVRARECQVDSRPPAYFTSQVSPECA